MVVLWLLIWLVNRTPPLWVQHHANLAISSDGAGLTNCGIAGAILLMYVPRTNEPRTSALAHQDTQQRYDLLRSRVEALLGPPEGERQ